MPSMPPGLRKRWSEVVWARWGSNPRPSDYESLTPTQASGVRAADRAQSVHMVRTPKRPSQASPCRCASRYEPYTSSPATAPMIVKRVRLADSRDWTLTQRSRASAGVMLGG